MHRVRRVPMLSGSRVVLVPAGDDDLLIRPPPPPEQVVDTGAATRDALRFPLSGEPLQELARGNGRTTIVVQPDELPVPGAQVDPRSEALAATIDELARCGVPDSRQTLLVAGGLGQRLGQRDLERLLPPPRARAFRGRVLVHDIEDPGLVPIAEWEGSTVRVHPAIIDADLVVVVGAAETVLHGGPGVLVPACDAATVRRAADAESLVEASGTAEWSLALHVEQAVAQRVGLIGVSLVLDLPRLTGSFRGYPDEPDSLDRVARSSLRRVFSLLPATARRDVLTRQGRRLVATAAFAGRPSVAHAEALLRGVELRGARLTEAVDALVVGVPWTGPHVPREPVNAVTAAALVLGLALRLTREAFPIEPGGTLVLLHPLTRSFGGGAQAPYAAMFRALRTAQEPDDLVQAERQAEGDVRAQDAYRAGRTCHPLLPFADWAGCAPTLRRVGRVVVAGSRDAVAARALGFVPTRGIGSALEMAHGVAGGRARIGILLAPPYAPLIVG
jgi:Lactate racemase N-terminal domain